MKKIFLILLAMVFCLCTLIACDEGEAHTHEYTVKNVDTKYLKSEANAESAAIYYYSCSCGEKGEETFTVGDPLDADGGEKDDNTGNNTGDSTGDNTGNGDSHTHVYQNEWSKDGTHHWLACIDMSCSSTLNKAPHAFGEWSVDKEPTCAAIGTRYRTCGSCGYVENGTLPVNEEAHRYATEWTVNGTHHWYKCLNTGCTSVKDKAEHSFSGATCTGCGCSNTATFTVVFEFVDMNGVSLGLPSVTRNNVPYGAAVTAPQGYVNNLQSFDDVVVYGWDSNGDKVADEGYKSVASNLTVKTLCRVKDNYSVILYAANGSTELGRFSVKEGSTVTENMLQSAAEPPVVVGKRFAGWEFVRTGSASDATCVTADCAFKATYRDASDGIIPFVTDTIEIDGEKDTAYSKGVYLPLNAGRQADRHWGIKDISEGGTRGVPNLSADTWIVWDGDYIYVITEVSDKTLVGRNPAYINGVANSYINDTVELWYSFEQDMSISTSYTGLGVDAMGVKLYAAGTLQSGIGRGRSTHFLEIEYATRTAIGTSTTVPDSTLFASGKNGSEDAPSYRIEVKIPAWTEGAADIANYDVDEATGRLLTAPEGSTDPNHYKFTTGEKLIAGDFVRLSLQVNDLQLDQETLADPNSGYYDSGVPGRGSWLYDYSGEEVPPDYVFSASGNTQIYTEYYVCFALGDTDQAQTKIWAITGSEKDGGQDTRTFWADAACTQKYVRPE